MTSLRPPACTRAREWISLSLDGELSEFEQVLMTAHVERCGECRAFAADADGFTTSLRLAAPEPLRRPVVVPRRRNLGIARRGAQLASAGFAAAAAVLGVVLLPERASLRVGDDRTSLVAPRPVSSEANELVIAVRRPGLERQNLRVLPRPSRGIGAVKPPASPS